MTPRQPVRHGCLWRSGLALAALCTLSTNAHAQQPFGRVAMETVASVSSTSSNFTDPMIVLDAVGTVRLTSGFDVVIRPYSRRLPGGDWASQMYQLQVRYQTTRGVPLRVDAGVISATIFNIEGEYAAGYTRLSGEWIADRFETNGPIATARGFNVLATRTLTPRWFAGGRLVRVSSPAAGHIKRPVRSAARSGSTRPRGR